MALKSLSGFFVGNKQIMVNKGKTIKRGIYPPEREVITKTSINLVSDDIFFSLKIFIQYLLLIEIPTPLKKLKSKISFGKGI